MIKRLLHNHSWTFAEAYHLGAGHQARTLIVRYCVGCGAVKHDNISKRHLNTRSTYEIVKARGWIIPREKQ